jgi:hypothetical protein
MTIIRFNPDGKPIGGFKAAKGPYLPFTLSEHERKEIGKGKIALDASITYPRATYHYTFLDEHTRLHKSAGREVAAGLSVPVYFPTGGNANAFYLTGRKWALPANVIMSLKDDAILAATGMPKDKGIVAIGAACSEWNRCTSGKPFNPKATTTILPNWKLDGVNNCAFQPYPVGYNALAATGVWYKTQGVPVGTMYPILESDMTFNSNRKWGLGEPGKLDFQSVVLHELGHAMGLGDLCGRAQFAQDTRQVMHYYTGVKRVLGNGDATGVWKLYG